MPRQLEEFPTRPKVTRIPKRKHPIYKYLDGKIWEFTEEDRKKEFKGNKDLKSLRGQFIGYARNDGKVIKTVLLEGKLIVQVQVGEELVPKSLGRETREKGVKMADNTNILMNLGPEALDVLEAIGDRLNVIPEGGIMSVHISSVIQSSPVLSQKPDRTARGLTLLEDGELTKRGPYKTDFIGLTDHGWELYEMAFVEGAGS